MMLNFFTRYILKNIRKKITQSFAVIVPPSGYGSIGDDAMVRVLIKNINDHNLTPIILGGHEALTWSQLDNIKIKAADSRKPFTTIANLLLILLKSQKLYIVGADIMDGHYDSNSVLKRLKLAKIFSNAGIDVTFTGFSFNNKPNRDVCRELNNLNNLRYYIRDVVSYERFKSHTSCVPELSADLAFLTQSSDEIDNVTGIINWINERKVKDNLVIIVNINWLPFRSAKISIEKLIKRYSDICFELNQQLNNNVSILITPNDFRDAEKFGDIRLAGLLYESIFPVLGEKCMLVDTSFNAEELKLFTQKCDFLITGRMHLAIICSTNAIPAFSVSYQQKFSGFYQHLGLDPSELMIEPCELFDDDIFNKILTNIRNRGYMQKMISNNISHIKEMSQRNFS